MADPVDPVSTADRPLPSELPVVALRHTVVFPLSVAPLAIRHPLTVNSVNRALAANRMVVLVLEEDADDETPSPDRMKRIGTVGIIRQMARTQNGLQVLVEGTARVRLDNIRVEDDALVAAIAPLPEPPPPERSVEVDAHVRRLRELVERAFSVATGLSPELRAIVASIDDPLRLCYLVASLIDMKPADKQLLLEQDSLTVKLTAVSTALSREIELLEIKGRIESQAQKEMSDAQRQYFLRQQMKAIQSELGEAEGQEMQELRERIAQANLPEATLKAVMREVDRLERMQQASPEYQMIRTYIDWVLDVPWSKTTEDRLDPTEARRVLDEDHYDLDKVKDRIVEYLAVRKLKGDMKGPILCFVGPPGVGKTSLGQSIARAMTRQFVRLSLGGVRDEAEIRGHRRTYIGSMPGRVIQALKQAGSANPVFMLDEVDKMSVGFQGDPAAALLEVLDPAQNFSFRDHYLEIPFDLSKVLFIATANQLGPVHPALLDRMEIITLSGYTEEDKVHIARRYLIPRQLSEHGLPASALELTDRALRRVISEYTREAGVRGLERQLGTIARKIAARVAGMIPTVLPVAATGAPPVTEVPASSEVAPTETPSGAGPGAGPAPGAARPGSTGSTGSGSTGPGSAGPGSTGRGSSGTGSTGSGSTGPASTGSGSTGSGSTGSATGSGTTGDGSTGPFSSDASRATIAALTGAVGAAVIPTTVVDAESVPEYLGQPRFKQEAAFRTSRPGVATGLAWTETGGDVLFIEASLLPGGKGELLLTGQLGNVMQESARAAVSHIRAHAEALGVDPDFFASHDLHVHVPAGAIPKDGPSAGVTMATAILSALRKEPVREDVAMTGEITLSGLVLPVGGIREKSLAARRHGIKTMILPAQNESDLEDLPQELKDDMRFVPASTLDEVLQVALPSTSTMPAPVS